MAIKTINFLLELATFLFLITFFVEISIFSSRFVLCEETVDGNEDPEIFILDETPPVLANHSISSKTRVLFSHYKKIKKGMRCSVSSYYNICNAVWANNRTSLLNCCKKHCHNILGDRNNCGRCGHKCGFRQRCCGGVCTHVGFNPSHCGKCNKKCAAGGKCEYGFCGYA